jgi:HEAT repeat protein
MCWLALAGNLGIAQVAKKEVFNGDERTSAFFPGKVTVLKRGTFDNPAEEQEFVDHYTKDFFPRWTLPEFWGRQPFRPPPTPSTDFIRDLCRDLKYAAEAATRLGTRQVYDRLNAITLENMLRLAKSKDKNYHPATRLNATLMIGELNVPEAIPALLGLAQDAKQSELVRVAAMVGLIRHANPDIHRGNPDAVGISEPATVQLSDPATIQAVTAAMVAIAEKPAPDPEKADGANWLRAQAAEVLGLLGLPGNNGSVVKALVAMLHDAQLPLAQRCRAAYALGQLNYGGATLSGGPCLDALGGLARDALTAQQKGSLNQRGLKGHINDVLAGLRGADDQHSGVGALAKTAAEQTRRDGLLRVLDPLCDALDDVNLSDTDVATKVKEALSALAPLVKGP